MINYDCSISLRKKYNYKIGWCCENSYNLCFNDKRFKRVSGFIINDNVAIFHHWNSIDNMYIDVTSPATLNAQDVEYYSIDEIDYNSLKEELCHMNDLVNYYKDKIEKFVKKNSDMEIISHRDTTTGEIIYFNKPDRN